MNSDAIKVANLIVVATHEFKQTVNTRQELQRLLDTLKLSVCAMLEP